MADRILTQIARFSGEIIPAERFALAPKCDSSVGVFSSRGIDAPRKHTRPQIRFFSGSLACDSTARSQWGGGPGRVAPLRPSAGMGRLALLQSALSATGRVAFPQNPNRGGGASFSTTEPPRHGGSPFTSTESPYVGRGGGGGGRVALRFYRTPVRDPILSSILMKRRGWP